MIKLDRVLVLFLLIVNCLTFSLTPVFAQTNYAPYIWEKIWVTPNSTPNANEQFLRQELIDQVNQFLDWAEETSPPKPPGPFYVAQGYIVQDLFWLNPGELVLVLSQSLDFLPSELRNRTIDYLKYVMTTPNISPLTYNIQNGVNHPLLDRHIFRNYYSTLPQELAPPAINSAWVSQIVPQSENLYAVWAFAHYVSQYELSTSQPKAWDIINNNWNQVTTIYNRLPATPSIYWEIMGYVGYARMARQLNKSYTTAESRANSGYSAGTNFVQFYRDMGNSRSCDGNNGTTSWTGTWDYCLFASVDPYDLHSPGEDYNHQGYAGETLENKPAMFAPEIGRFMHDQIQNTVLSNTGYGLNRYISPQGASYFPFWFENKGFKSWGVLDANSPLPGNGENALMHPSFAWQMFMLKAYVESTGISQSRADDMKNFLDTPWAIGDNFHLEKLLTLLRMYSTIQWADTDPRVSSPTPTIVPSPTPTPAFSIADLVFLISRYLNTDDRIYQPVDSKVNMLDAAYLIRWIKL